MKEEKKIEKKLWKLQKLSDKIQGVNTNRILLFDANLCLNNKYL